MNDLLPIKEAVFEMSLYFNQQPNDERITAYAKALSNYTPKQIIFAFKEVINSGTPFFPSLAEILKHLKVESAKSEDIGNFVANEIIQKVIEFGSHRLVEAYEALSPVSKKALGDNRYLLVEIANSDQDSLPTIRAQIRGMAKSDFEFQKTSDKASKLKLVGIDSKLPELRTMDYSSYLPEAKS